MFVFIELSDFQIPFTRFIFNTEINETFVTRKACCIVFSLIVMSIFKVYQEISFSNENKIYI